MASTLSASGNASPSGALCQRCLADLTTAQQRDCRDVPELLLDRSVEPSRQRARKLKGSLSIFNRAEWRSGSPRPAVEGGRPVSLGITYPSKELRDMVLGTGMTDGMEASYARLDREVLTA